MLENLLSEKSLAQKLNISYWTVRNFRIKYGMPFVPIGKKIFYNLESVTKWLQGREQTYLATDINVSTTLTKSSNIHRMNKIY